MKRVFSLPLLFSLVLSVNLIATAEEPNHEKLKNELGHKPLHIVVISNDNPYSFVLPDGTITGLYVEFWKLWSSTNNYPISFSVTDFEDGIRKVKNSEAVHMGLFRNSERDTWADFSLPIARVETGIIFNRSYSSHLDFGQEKLNVGVLKGSFQAGYLADKYPLLHLHLFTEIDKTIAKLLTGELDAIVAEVPILRATINKHELNGVLHISDDRILKNYVHGVLAKGNTEVLSLINKGIENIPIRSLNELFKTWLPSQALYLTEFQELTLAEREWLQGITSLKFGMDSSTYPFGFFDKKSEQLGGIVADYVNHISKTLNIELKPENQYSWTESLQAVKSGKLDVLADIVNTPQRREELNFTTPYFIADNVMVALEHNVNFNSLNMMIDKTVGVLPGYDVELINRDYPSVNLTLVESVIDGLNRVRSKEIDVFVGPIEVINYEINRNQISNLRITAFLPHKLKLSMTVRQGLEPLIPILNKVFDGMTEKQKAEINNRWMPVYVKTGVDKKTVLIWVLPVVILILMVSLIAIININRRLQKEVATREKAEKDAVNANNAKSEFLSRMSHELRTPMNAILGFNQLLEASPNVCKDDKESVAEIKRAGHHLLGLINEVLDLAAIESGKLSLSIEPVQISDLFEECTHLINPQAAKRNVKININMLEDLSVKADHIRLKQCLLNLLSNAVKYNKYNGEIFLSATKNSSGDKVIIEVRDTGEGIPKDKQKHLFTPFERLSSEPYMTEGTGIGLTITAQLIQLMDATITFESDVGKGSTFTLELPYCQSPVQTSKKTFFPHAETLSVHAKRDGRNVILYIDDNPANIRLVERLFANREDITFLSAHEPKLGIELAEVTEPSLILLDITMPVMDGFQVLKILQDKFQDRLAPVIAVTANAMRKDIEKGLNAGFSDYLTKPLDVTNFYDTVDKHLSAA